MKKRTEWSHKYDFGHLLVVGGNWKYSGSPAFNALAALRSGVDLVTITAPERAANIIATFSPDLITVPLVGNYITSEHVELITDIAKNEKVSAVVVGGGMGRQVETLDAIKKIHEQVDLPFVFDADALYAIAMGNLKPRENDILTPHGGEFNALFGIKPSTNIKERKKQAENAANRTHCVILLKGWIDIITDGKKTQMIKKSRETVYMTKGGTGDVLAGIAGGLLAQGIQPFEAACLAAKINGVAGEKLGKEKKAGLLASDLLEKIPAALKKLKN